MAYTLPNGNPYLGGINLDSSPYTNYFLQNMAHQKAKEEAFDKYVGELNQKVTPAGMRAQDVGGFTNEVNQWRQDAVKNKKLIQNPNLDNGQALNTFNAGYQNLLSRTAQSKNLADTDKTISQLKTNPDTWDRVDASTINDIANHSKSIYDPQHKPFDIASVHYDPKPMDYGKFTEDLIKGKTQSATGAPTITADPNDKLTNIITTPLGYSKEDMASIGQRAAYNYHANPSFKNDVDKNVVKEVTPRINEFGEVEIPNPQRAQALNTLFKNVYGRDMNISPNDHTDLAAAVGLEIANATGQKVERQPNRNAQMQATQTFQQQQAAQKHLYTLDEIKARGLNEKDLYAWKDEYKDKSDSEKVSGAKDLIDASIEHAKSNPPLVYKTKDGKSENRYEIQVSPATAALFAVKNNNGHPVMPDKILVNEDGTQITPVYFSRFNNPSNKNDKKNGTILQKNGKASINEEITKPISKDEVVLRATKDLFGVDANKKLGAKLGETTIQKSSSTSESKWSKYKRN